MTPIPMSPLRAPGLAVPGAEDVRATAASIAAAQHPSGAIPWDTSGDSAGKVDAWDHVECAMALVAAGEDGAAHAAYAWLADSQRPDGTWPMQWRAGPAGVDVVDAGSDTNQVAYVAVGVYHHWLVRADAAFVDAMWPVVARALDTVVAHQLPGGGIAWGRGDGGAATTALLAGSSSVLHALRAGVALAEVLGQSRPAWAAAADRLADALFAAAAGGRPGDFEDKSRYSMDWYYPVLGGALRGPAAHARIASRWDDFVVPGLGIRCVDDHPWVTGAETCELALALHGLGDVERAAVLVGDMQHLREDDGSYHTGLVYADGKRWPIERSTWTGAAVILAVDALRDLSGGAAAFRL